MARPSTPTRVLPALIFLVLLHHVVAVTVRSIPSTPDNQQFFTLAQALIENGDRKISSCGPDLPDIERCIIACNSPGLAERGGCCCIARANDFTVGLRGGCRYSQRVQNFTTRFIYKSSPITANNRYFGATSCARNAPTGNGAPCTCSIQWEASAETLQMAAPLPTPSISPSPDLTASPSPVTQVPPLVTPEPSPPVITEEPIVDETVTPTPDSELIPAGTLPGRDPESPVVTDDPTSTAEDDLSGLLGDSPEPSPNTEGGDDDDADDDDDAEQQASEDDGSVCVDERYLKERGFLADTLVHQQAILATVLCPHARTLPCGTPDHKVRFNGEDMSYESMCALAHVQCRVSKMKVNSVYTHLWTDVAHEDVMLTMFDSRYAEPAQKVLHAVMRAWRTAKNRVIA